MTVNACQCIKVLSLVGAGTAMTSCKWLHIVESAILQELKRQEVPGAFVNIC